MRQRPLRHNRSWTPSKPDAFHQEKCRRAARRAALFAIHPIGTRHACAPKERLRRGLMVLGELLRRVHNRLPIAHEYEPDNRWICLLCCGSLD